MSLIETPKKWYLGFRPFNPEIHMMTKGPSILTTCHEIDF